MRTDSRTIQVMLEGEDVLTLSDLAKRLKAAGHGRFRPETLKRWIRDGKRGVHLEGCPLGRSWWSSIAAISRFSFRLMVA